MRKAWEGLGASLRVKTRLGRVESIDLNVIDGEI